MDFLNKIKAIGQNEPMVSRSDRLPVATNGAPVRICYGLREFIARVEGIEKGRLLDLGPIAQSTVNFFIQRGFKVYSEDLLRTWTEMLEEEEKRLRDAKPAMAGEEVDEPDPLSDRLMEAVLQYPHQFFDAVLAWDSFDYFETSLATRLIWRLYDLVRPGGVVLVLFHSKRPDQCHRYRLADEQTIELLPGPTTELLRHIFQNREIQELFGRFQDSRTFVGRDQLREALFTK